MKIKEFFAAAVTRLPAVAAGLALAGLVWLAVHFGPLLKFAIRDYWTVVMHPQFTHWWLIFLLPVLLIAVALVGKRQMTIRHSTLAPHEERSGWGAFIPFKSWSLLVVVSYLCLTLMAVNFNLAFMGPTVPEKTVQHLVQTRKICVPVDSSGSMMTELTDDAKELKDDEAKALVTPDPGAVTVDSGTNTKVFVPGTTPQDTKPHKMTRSEAAQLAARYLIRHRMTADPNNTDQFCLMRFDDDVYMMAPLTNDKLALMLRTSHITENVGGGTNFVVALQKTYDYMMLPENTSDSSVRVIIMITDGYDSIDPEKRKEFVAKFKDSHIKFYVIGLGDGWTGKDTMDLEKFANELQAADPHSGIVFRASNPGQMQASMQKIDELERAQEVFETQQFNRDVDYAFILAAIFWLVAYFVCLTLARRNP